MGERLLAALAEIRPALEADPLEIELEIEVSCPNLGRDTRSGYGLIENSL